MRKLPANRKFMLNVVNIKLILSIISIKRGTSTMLVNTKYYQDNSDKPLSGL